jgi:hypothetical protein
MVGQSGSQPYHFGERWFILVVDTFQLFGAVTSKLSTRIPSQRAFAAY